MTTSQPPSESVREALAGFVADLTNAGRNRDNMLSIDHGALRRRIEQARAALSTPPEGNSAQPEVREGFAWHVRTHEEIRDQRLPFLPDGKIYGWRNTSGKEYMGDGYPVTPNRFALDHGYCEAILIRCAALSSTPAQPEPVAEMETIDLFDGDWSSSGMADRLDNIGDLEDDDAETLTRVAKYLRTLSAPDTGARARTALAIATPVAEVCAALQHWQDQATAWVHSRAPSAIPGWVQPALKRGRAALSATPEAQQVEAVAWLYEKNGKRSLQAVRQPWNTQPDRGWTETPLYAALAHTPAPDATDREKVARCIQIIERNLYRQHEKIEDVPAILRSILAQPQTIDAGEDAPRSIQHPPLRPSGRRGMNGDLRCVEGRLFRHDPQYDDPDLETDVGPCPDCSGDGCGDDGEPVSKIGRSAHWSTTPRTDVPTDTRTDGEG